MKKKLLYFIFVVVIFPVVISAQGPIPKREFRAAWLTTVGGSDWPSSSQSSEQQKNHMMEILDSLKKYGMNVVIFQVRSECDAMFQSDLEPWSIYLTGRQGQAPNPYYDPLQFAVQEAHKRGMELHAWFNPYRVKGGTFSSAFNYITNTHPEWILTIEGGKILDPGLQVVREHVTRVISDVVRRYDVDGVHMDDFFYPYPNPTGITTQDDSTFIKYPRGFTNRGDWRRDNVNLLIKAINDSVHAIKPNVKFGMSPFGIWKSGTPTGITGLSAYFEIYCDAINWLQKRAIDYVTPQLYWAIGGNQDYRKLSSWWADSAASNGRHFYPGLAAYRISSAYSSSELPNQIRINRGNPKIQGDVFFTTSSIMNNPKGFADSLKNDLHRYPALRPVMSWHDLLAPNAPRNFRFARLPNSGISGLQWDLPLTATDGDSANMYVIYKFGSGNITPADLENTANIADITSQRFLTPRKSFGVSPLYFVATSLDRNCNESVMSAVVQMAAPEVPLLALPANGAGGQRDTTVVRWSYTPGAVSYTLQVSTDSTFSSSFTVNKEDLGDTLFAVTGVLGQQKYFWRVRAKNPAGTGQFSAPFSFSTGFPLAVALSQPAQSSTGNPTSPVLKWFRQPGGATYRVQFARGIVGPSTMIFDSSGVTDTVLAVSGLLNGEAYFWRVRAVNQYGSGEWSAQWGFRVAPSLARRESANMPDKWALEQNFPNPFNPVTQIRFSVLTTERVSVIIYDLLGNHVRTITDAVYPPGEFGAEWDGRDENMNAVPSGVYICRMETAAFIQSRKMSLVK